jgi:predicted Holliday junction resolvase-like endonuclease
MSDKLIYVIIVSLVFTIVGLVVISIYYYFKVTKRSGLENQDWLVRKSKTDSNQEKTIEIDSNTNLSKKTNKEEKEEKEEKNLITNSSLEPDFDDILPQ